MTQENTKSPFVVLICLLVVLVSCDHGRDAEDAKRKIRELNSITPAYRSEALRLMVGEANQVAQGLSLREDLPFSERNVITAHVTPPRIAQGMKAIGNVTTSNYVYYFSVDNKFSFLVRTDLEREYGQLRSQYLWPISRMDTNAAYQLATQFLSAASMDVSALNRDCQVKIRAYTPEGKTGQHFVPVYWVYWTKGEVGHGSVASIELFVPTKTVRQMHVNESKYILRKPLQMQNVE